MRNYLKIGDAIDSERFLVVHSRKKKKKNKLPRNEPIGYVGPLCWDVWESRGWWWKKMEVKTEDQGQNLKTKLAVASYPPLAQFPAQSPI